MNYARQIINMLGSDSFFKGRIIPLWQIKFIKTSFVSGRYFHEYKVRSQRTSDWYDIVISNNGQDIYDYTCSCLQFKNEHTCKHLSAVLMRHIDDIISCEYIDKNLISQSILNKYASEKKRNIKKQVNLEIEFELLKTEVKYKVLIGENKLYTVSSISKFNDLMTAFNNKESYCFGKNFTLNFDEHYFNNQDIEILKYLFNYKRISYNYYYAPDPFSLSYREFTSFLKIAEKKKFTIKGHGQINNVYYRMPTNYTLTLNNDEYNLDIENIDEYSFYGETNNYIVYRNDLYILPDDELEYINILKQNKIDSLVFKKDDLSTFSTGLLKKIKNNIHIDNKIEDVKIPNKPDVKIYFDIKDVLECNIKFVYDGEEIDYFDKVSFLRDDETEEEVINKLIDYHFYEKNQKYILDDEDLIYDFLDNILPELSKTYEIFTSKKIDNTKILKKISTNSNFSIGQDGIMSYQFDAENIDPKELENVFKALKNKKKYYKLKNNNVVALEENADLNDLNNLLTNLDINGKDLSNGKVTIPKYHALYIDSLKNSQYKNIKTNNLFDEFIQNFKKYRNLKIDFTPEDEVLRDYQKVGVKWLTTIYKCDLGGILADEMGLGKTLQAICFIKQILKEKNGAKILIVAPTSLIYNWEKEFEKFAPNLKYVVVAENKNKRKEIFKTKDQYNIFITTYGLIRNDNDEYEHMNFELCIIDEAQTIKNYQSGMTREVKKIKAKCKVALTGTPVENNVTEIWSIFDFIMPGYLNSILKFREKYNIKDVNEEDIKILKTLNYKINPFILRRKKMEVIKSLPEKQENNIYIELPKTQKMLYVKELNDTKKQIDDLIGEGGFVKSKMKILQLLMKLRQICIDPSVMYENYVGESIKIVELLNIVKQNIDNGHKILIFSSFKRVLENVKQIFKENSISSYMIDGSVKSKERMNYVDAFNKDNTNCFLITLKAGGTGLNLTGADVVIHLDIWWNPQVENQATDRAHRIGQTKKVNVIKLITKGTIEERILELQEKKKILSENLIEGKQTKENLSSLTEKDIKKLLSYNDD